MLLYSFSADAPPSEHQPSSALEIHYDYHMEIVEVAELSQVETESEFTSYFKLVIICFYGGTKRAHYF